MSLYDAYSVLGHILNSQREAVQATSLPPPDKLVSVVRQARAILKKEKNILQLDGEFEVVGDIHGDLESLLTIFQKKGYPNVTKYIFLGDYVDRGDFSVEVIALLFSLKCLFPERIFLIRGNHELSSVCRKYQFMDECVSRVDMPFYKNVLKAFSVLPLGAVVNSEIFCVHGGIPETEMTILELNDVKKPLPKEFRDIQEELLWSDPKSGLRFDEFEYNSVRKAGSFFGRKALMNFFDSNNLNYLIRAHEVCQDGYDLPLGEEVNCVTIFSSSDHRDGNIGATVTIGNDSSVSLCQFEKEEEFFEILQFITQIEHDHQFQSIVVASELL